MTPKLFENKVAIVTGGGSGIGGALCQELGSRGATVVVADLNLSRAEDVASAISRAGGRACAVRIDVTKEVEVEKIICGAVAEYGRLDYMFNNAGIALFGDARDLSLEQWRQVLDVNLNGVLYGTVITYPIMVRQGFGHIVNVASSAGLSPAPTEAAYCTSKYGVVGLSLSLRPEGADLGVKVSVVCPGYVQTNIFQSATVVNVAPEKRGLMRLGGATGRSKAAPMILNPRKTMDASKAARSILEGVSHNRAIIVFPAGVRVEWWLYRLSPGLMDRMLRLAARDFRKYRA